MTGAPRLADETPPLATANEWVALPAVEGASGAIRTVEVLSMRARGLLGLAASANPWEPPPRAAGSPASLLEPVLAFDGRPLDLGATPAAVERVEDWVIALSWGPSLRLVLWAPIGHRGFVVRMTATNPGTAPVEAVLGLSGVWSHVVFSLFRSRPMPVALSARRDPWTGTLAMEAASPWPVLGWAVGTDEPAELELEPPASPEGGSSAVRFAWRRRVRIEAGGEASATFYVAVGPEADAARTTVVDLRRRGWRRLLDETLAWLRARRFRCDDVELERRINQNLLFGGFFSCGRALDTEEWVAVTSRSPRYYVSAAYWARDALLWSLPGLLRLDPSFARRLLCFAFRFGWRNPGIHAQYMDGTVIYPGFELDELAAYPVALGRYLRATADASILQEPEVVGALKGFGQVLQELAGSGPLYPTFLDPSDDPPPYPFLTYDNALLWRGLVELAAACRQAGLEEQAEWAGRTADCLRGEILARCVVEGPFGPMFAWAVDGQGGFALYDDPPGSLVLLGRLGLCAPGDPVLANTIRWVTSRHNPHWYEGPFGAPGCAHSPGPWPMALANLLLAGPAAAGMAKRALDTLRTAPMDGGIVCETMEAASGRACTGAAFASAAAYVAAALMEVLEGPS